VLLLLLADRGGKGDEKGSMVTAGFGGVWRGFNLLVLWRGPGWAPVEVVLLLPRWKWVDGSRVANLLNKHRLRRPLPIVGVVSLLSAERGGLGEWEAASNLQVLGDGCGKMKHIVLLVLLKIDSAVELLNIGQDLAKLFMSKGYPPRLAASVACAPSSFNLLEDL
jgi:hypothetical protein